MEHVQGDLPLRHAVHKACDRFFIIAGGEGGGEPQAEGPGGGQGRAACEGGVVLQHGFAVSAADDHEIQLLSRHGELHPGDHLGADLIRDLPAGVYQHAVALVGQIEGDIFISDLRTGAAVLIPHVHHLSVFHKGRKALAQAVDLFADVQIHLATHKGPFRGFHGADHGVAEAVADLSELLSVIIISKGGGIFRNAQLGFSADDGKPLFRFRDLQGLRRFVQLKLRFLPGAAHKVVGLGAKNIGLGRGDEQLQHRAAHSPYVVRIGNGIEIDAVFFDFDLPDLHAVRRLYAGEIHPVALGKFHGKASFLKLSVF